MSTRGRLLVWRRVCRHGDGAFLSFFGFGFAVFHLVFIGFRLCFFRFVVAQSGLSAAFRFGCKSLVSK